MEQSSISGVQRPVLATVFIGLTVGLLDGAAAVISSFLRSGVTPDKVFRYISSALLGKDAYSGDGGIIALGVFLHFVVAYIWGAIFFTAYPRVRLLQQNRWLVGCAYGLFVWLMMNFVVLRFTRTPQLKFSWEGAVVGWGIHMLCVGLPIVLITHYWYRRP
ncbi:hypothetical protein GFS24_27200 [Chitinophaga sp. SYP-B3965]|uniref:hypothetical protein n=1 Tax=Chitinophaga sp. SYP-B3965 TaxID=2663120 RepID=UPI001299643C|nr:hypothetical protein [Chitinophaga sp. SYP-B3965]MRG48827.1 hypothetical protein [Chitinophaga sp. SYP-B3965]